MVYGSVHILARVTIPSALVYHLRNIIERKGKIVCMVKSGYINDLSRDNYFMICVMDYGHGEDVELVRF